MHTQVAIIGAGPAGLLLGHLLERAGIATVILESRSQSYVEGRIRAGVLEHGTVEILRESGVGQRMDREGLAHDGIEILFDGQRHRIDLAALTGGRSIMVYGQHEVVKDLISARQASARPLFFEAESVAVDGVDGTRPEVRFTLAGEAIHLTCDFVCGCDGFHGMTRDLIPLALRRDFDRIYPFAWLGILAQAAPAAEELIYASSERGFALFSMRSPTVTRLYLQCAPDEDIDQWPDERIWEELDARLYCDDGWAPTHGPILQKGVTAMRSFVSETMQHGRLFIAGDAAHIVPPTGAKGMNLAISDVRHLAFALSAHFQDGRDDFLNRYSESCLKRVWRAEHFSWWMTSMLHTFDGASPFEARVRKSELEYLVSSRAFSTTIAENYVGLPWTDAA